MSLSSFALILGVFFYVFGFPMVFCDEHHLTWRKKILQDSNLMRIAGMAFAMIAAVTLKRQWVISQDGEGFVVAFAWIVLLKSLFIAWWPGTYARFRDHWEQFLFDTPAMQVFLGFVMVLVAALFTYLGILLP